MTRRSRSVRMPSLQMAGHADVLSRKRETAIAALLNRRTMSGAAEDGGLSEGALRRCLRDSAYHRSDTLTHASGVPQGGVGEAVEALRATLTGPTTAPAREVERLREERRLNTPRPGRPWAVSSEGVHVAVVHQAQEVRRAK